MIDGIGRNQPPQFASAANGSLGGPANGPAALNSKRNSVQMPELSGVAREFATAPPVDTARVSALRLAIGNGSYAVDPEAVAARMIAFYRGSSSI